MSKVMTIVGPAHPVFDEIDKFMSTYMEQYNLNGGSIAIAKNGQILYAKGFTWAERGSQIVQPTSLFRIASCSKLITGFMIHSLFQKKGLSLDSFVKDHLAKFNYPPPPANDPKPSNLFTEGHYLNAVTVRHLLAHEGGWDRYAPPNFKDLTYYSDVQVASVLNNGKLPITKAQLVAWALTQKQQFYPGATSKYSNFGYLLLGMVIENITGLSYINAVKTLLFDPLNIKRPQQSLALEKDTQPGEVKYYQIPERTKPCVMGNGGLCPERYGAENNNNFDSFGGWILSAVDYVKMLVAFRLQIAPMPKVASNDDIITWTKEPNVSSKGSVYSKNGVLPGTWAYGFSRADGVDFMVIWNTTVEGTAEAGKDGKDTFTYNNKAYSTGDHGVIWHNLLDKINKWPSYDLTPAYFRNFSIIDSIVSKIQYDGVWNPINENRFFERGKTQEEFEQLYGKYYNMNYKLIFQNTYIVGTLQLRDGIWAPMSTGQFVTWGKTRSDFEKLYKEWWDKGFRLIHQQTYVKDGQLLFDGIWNPNTGGQFVTWEQPLDTFSKQYKEWWDKGFRLIHQQTYLQNGQLMYNGIWNPSTAPQFVTWEKTRDQFDQLYAEWWDKGFKLIQMQPCIRNGQLLYNGIWNPNSNGQYISWNKSYNLIDAENIENKSEGFQPTMIFAH